ncbi:hypothetical protein K438DRAFT_1874217 [Mycena galopus ATCC 62051]|nr:hypothetical protein K438DRAFT_1874217 [Mycena galopus ATCC 62051]
MMYELPRTSTRVEFDSYGSELDSVTRAFPRTPPHLHLRRHTVLPRGWALHNSPACIDVILPSPPTVFLLLSAVRLRMPKVIQLYSFILISTVHHLIHLLHPHLTSSHPLSSASISISSPPLLSLNYCCIFIYVRQRGFFRGVFLVACMYIWVHGWNEDDTVHT